MVTLDLHWAPARQPQEIAVQSAGRGSANSIAIILSAVVLLDWLKLTEPAELIDKGVAKTLADGAGTPDSGGILTTAEIADRAPDAINELKQQAGY